MRVKSEIWVKSYIRRCSFHNVYAVIVRRGDSDAGAIYIKINTLDGQGVLLTPAPAGFLAGDSDRKWVLYNEGQAKPEEELDTYLNKQNNMDEDMWIVEVEDKEGRLFLEDEIMEF